MTNDSSEKYIMSVTDNATGFLDELDHEIKAVRLRLQDVDLSTLNEEQKIEHDNAVHLSNRLYFHFWQTRKRFLRKEIRRDQCIDIVTELVEDWATEAGLHPERL
jgi:hypothetical protein